MRKSEPETFAYWHRTPHLTAIPGGETLYEMASRIAGVLRMIVSRHAGETVLLAGHDNIKDSMSMSGVSGDGPARRR